MFRCTVITLTSYLPYSGGEIRTKTNKRKRNHTYVLHLEPDMFRKSSINTTVKSKEDLASTKVT